jgi:hypothetical protein
MHARIEDLDHVKVAGVSLRKIAAYFWTLHSRSRFEDAPVGVSNLRVRGHRPSPTDYRALLTEGLRGTISLIVRVSGSCATELLRDHDPYEGGCEDCLVHEHPLFRLSWA